MTLDLTTTRQLGLGTCIDLGLDRLEVSDDRDWDQLPTDDDFMDQLWSSVVEEEVSDAK